MRTVVAVILFLALLQSASALPTLAKRGEAKPKGELQAKYAVPNDGRLCVLFGMNCDTVPPQPSTNYWPWPQSPDDYNPSTWPFWTSPSQTIPYTPNDSPYTDAMIGQSLKAVKDNNKKDAQA
ncbi:hypothetical protein PGT21_006427 [Puccinia graminis f. sp. tritici]|uniref:Uncharacterized protein n=2 Tax=Puccinia graminis f. sp. tritici TaxID=56615 RepID=E3KA10_PUCGT|nr:uncharacterized protein PGTG_07244 [Puccinia graminis f. sp. tritici CRL 75-36-700-3]EFP80992.1 hypothetical protein PGTG_07244 [Puccinia graminis f. sp. tritici CRL 75-36-700-3]KAA1068937.1 hypothetical protein PGT21_006427 [Puccinia graminis f. sp. tritici]